MPNEPIVVNADVRAAKDLADVPAIVLRAGDNARFAYEEFLYGEIENEHTRKVYRYNLHRFFDSLDQSGVPLTGVTPKIIRTYIDGLVGNKTNEPLGPASKKQHLAAIRFFFDKAVTRHAVALNPALSVRGPKYSVVEGKTAEITVKDARKLLASIDTTNLVGKRDLAIIAVLAYTGVRIGAVSQLAIRDFAHIGEQYVLRFDEKGGKSREIPVRHDLERILLDYLQAAGLGGDKPHAPLFRGAVGRTKQFGNSSISEIALCKMLKRRCSDIGLSKLYSPHSFRVAVATDLLTQGSDPSEVQYLLGHADPRTTQLYDRRKRKVTRNIVEKISL